MDKWRLFTIVSIAVLLPATSLAEPRRPNITRDGSGSGITGSMAIGVNKANTIWCSATADVRFMGTNQLSALFWQYSNGTRLPAVDTGQSSGNDVYMERFRGSESVNSATWYRALHFKTTPPSVAGNYTCVVNYNQRYWNQSVEVLVSDIHCGGDPHLPTNGQRSTFSTVYTSEVRYSCFTGYTLQGSDRRTCQSNGQWSGSPPQCNPIDCGDPGTPTNGQRSLSSTTYNSVVTYTCDVGYTLQGLSRRKCLHDGRWKGSAPHCIGKSTPHTSSTTSSTSSGMSPMSRGTYPTSSGTSPTSSGTSPTSRGTYPTGSGTNPTSRDTGPMSSVVTNINLSSPLAISLSWDTEAPNGTSFTVWYSTDGHESDPSSPPQGALVVSGLSSTSVTITLPNSDNSCRPYYVWIAQITPTGQQSPYSKRRQVEGCQASGGQSTGAAESAGGTVAGSFLGGVVAGGVAALLVVGILCGSWKLKHSGGKRWEEDSEERKENTYDTVGPKEPTAMSDHVAMETNPAYGVCS